MKCMYCGFPESKVIDSRSTDEGNSIRRRRECLKCGRRFTTYEVIEHTPILVVKNDGTRQPFDASKIKAGIIKACEKRPVAMQEIEQVVASIEKDITNTLEQEITSQKIGEMFRDVTTFVDFINEFEKMMKD